MEKDLAKIMYLEAFDELLNNIKISKNDVCIIGSAPFALYGVKENGDIDFIASKKARIKIEQYAKKNSNCKFTRDEGNIHFYGFNNDMHISRYDRHGYLGYTDHDIIYNKKNYILIDGYKIIRPEISLARMVAERREKDIKNLKIIEKSDIFEMNDWDWELVTLLPPWKRPQKNKFDSFLYYSFAFFQLLKNKGIKLTFLKSVDYITGLTFSKRKNLYDFYFHNWNLKNPVSTDVEIHYPLPNLLSRQYDKKGNFDKYDLIALIYGIKNNKKNILKKINYDEKEFISITKKGKINSGINNIAEKIIKWYSNFSNYSHYKTLIVNKSINKHKPFYLNDLKKIFPKDIVSEIEQERINILEKSGTFFHFILWPGIKNNFDLVENIIDKEIPIFKSEEYEIKEGFPDFVRDVYRFDKRSEKWLRETKIHHLNKFEPIIRVLSFEIKNPQFVIKDGQLVEIEAYDLKMKIRRKLSKIIKNYNYTTDLHASDNFENNIHLNYLLGKIKNKKYVNK